MKHGTFSGDIHVMWPSNTPRDMIVMEETFFCDNEGRTWKAGIGDRVDGASIPRVVWSITGSPFVGRFRRASVFHDIYCVTRHRPHPEVHKMFYEAMLADKVPKSKAWTMYQAVRIFGPKW